MGRALEDIGLYMLMVIAISVPIPEHFDLQSVNLVVGNQLKDGTMFLGHG